MFTVNVGLYSIHGSCGLYILVVSLFTHVLSKIGYGKHMSQGKNPLTELVVY